MVGAPHTSCLESYISQMLRQYCQDPVELKQPWGPRDHKADVVSKRGRMRSLCFHGKSSKILVPSVTSAARSFRIARTAYGDALNCCQPSIFGGHPPHSVSRKLRGRQPNATLTQTLTATPIVHTEGNRVFATSKDVAAYFGKLHRDVLRAIEELLFATAKACARNFAHTWEAVPMPNGGTRRTPVYKMDRDGFTLLAMGFTGKKALEFKLKYIAAFNEAERRLKMLEAAVGGSTAWL